MVDNFGLTENDYFASYSKKTIEDNKETLFDMLRICRGATSVYGLKIKALRKVIKQQSKTICRCQ